MAVCGVPAVAYAGASLAEPYSFFLRDLGLGTRLVASEECDYVGIALELAASAKAQAQARAAIARLGLSEDGVGRVARALEAQARPLLETASP